MSRRVANPDVSCLDLQVMGALGETERANDMLQSEIKELLSDQDEQHELRDELGDQLRERSDLMAQLAHQALSDTEQNSEILQRIAKLSEVLLCLTRVN